MHEYMNKKIFKIIPALISTLCLKVDLQEQLL